MHKYFYFFAPNTKCALVVALSGKSKYSILFGMAIGNGELKTYEWFPKHLRMGTARMKYDKETNEEG